MLPIHISKLLVESRLRLFSFFFLVANLCINSWCFGFVQDGSNETQFIQLIKVLLD